VRRNQVKKKGGKRGKGEKRKESVPMAMVGCRPSMGKKKKGGKGGEKGGKGKKTNLFALRSSIRLGQGKREEEGKEGKEGKSGHGKGSGLKRRIPTFVYSWRGKKKKREGERGEKEREIPGS